MIDSLPGDIFRPGQVLNHTYEVEGVLGRGGTGEVYRARNQISGRIVAIKALNARFSGNDDYIQLMKREEQMRDVLNDAVVRYAECSRTEQGHVFLVMDFIDGPTVNDLMMQRRMDPRELMIIAHRVAEGLVAAHTRGIVHRDLSPDNIILRDGAAERAMLIDFGIAKDTSAGAKTIVGNEFAGKYEYAAPEQLDGRAERRSDLYALGATLLAAYRGQVPFAGSTPGEMIRRKQSRLDTEGVPEPLKALIDWLTAPSMGERAPSAEAVVARVSETLRPSSKRQAKAMVTDDRGRTGRGGRLVVVLAALLALGGGGAWYAGVLDPILHPLPVASPYRLAASLGPDGATLSGNAPDPAAAERLRTAFAGATGTQPPETALSIAEGVPSDRWVADLAELMGILRGLQEWSLTVTDTQVDITGVGGTREQTEKTKTEILDWANRSRMKISADTRTGPRILQGQTILEALQPLATCGPLAPDRGALQTYGLGDTIAISGTVASAEGLDTLRSALEPMVGDRNIRLDVTVLNADLCVVRNVLPPVGSGETSIWFGDGKTGKVNLSGIYRAGDTPIVEVHLPAELSGLSLWVLVVDNTNQVFSLLPNEKQPGHDIQAIGATADGVRKIRVLHNAEDLQVGRGLYMIQVDADDFGKSEIIAILSKTSLFGTRLPESMSVAGFADELARVIREEPGNIVSVTTRVIDARP